MRRKDLPLTALRSFEAAGRNQSFSVAAGELGVSQAAISRQVKELEFRLGVRLFERLPQQVRLTAAGRDLLGELTSALDTMQQVFSRSRKSAPIDKLRISAEQGFASCWLLQRLEKFHEIFPDIVVELEASDTLIEFDDNSPHLAIRFSATQKQWRNCEALHLINQFMVPVQSAEVPNGKTTKSSSADFSDQRLIHESGGNDWSYWFAEQRKPYPLRTKVIYFNHMGLVLEAVRQGQGVGLMDEIFVRDHIASGELQARFAPTKGRGSYWLVARSFSKLQTDAMTFSKWLQKELHE